MAKVVFKTTPKAAYEWVEVEGGDTMKDYERSALLDDFIADNGLVPVETAFHGETPTHKYGRYKAAFAAPANALAPMATHGDDVNKLKSEKSEMEQELSRLRAQLSKKNAGKDGADEVEPMAAGIGGSTISTTDDAREALNQTDGINLVGASEEVREDMSTADRSDDNPVVDAPRRGRPPKSGN